MAIITRWRIPPENWWGYCLTRFSGSGIPTRRSISTASFWASARPMCLWPMRFSMICFPTRMVGLRAARASWKMMAHSPPL